MTSLLPASVGAIDLPWRPHQFALACLSLVSAGMVQSGLSGANGTYLTLPNAVPNGGDLYSHVDEAIHVYRLLKAGEFDFWFPFVTLGYPLFLAYQPLPILLVSLLMLGLDSYAAPEVVFRWVFVGLWALVPLTWGIGGRWLGLPGLECLLLGALSIGISSWRSFGLEFTSITSYGLYTQVYGAVLLPLAIGAFFRYLFHDVGGGSTVQAPPPPPQPSPLPSPQSLGPPTASRVQPIPAAAVVLIFTLTCLSHIFFAMYTGVACVIMLFVSAWLRAGWGTQSDAPVAGSGSAGQDLRRFLARFLDHAMLHTAKLALVLVPTCALIAWWILPLAVNIKYVGGLPWKAESENGYPVPTLLEAFFSGGMLDFGAPLPVITYSCIVGLALLVCSLLYSTHVGYYRRAWRRLASVFAKTSPAGQTAAMGTSHFSPDTGLYLTLLCLFSVTCVLFTGRTTLGSLYAYLPFHAELEVIRYLSGVQFCATVIGAVFLGFAVRVLAYLCYSGTVKLLDAVQRRESQNAGGSSALRALILSLFVCVLLPPTLIPYAVVRVSAFRAQLTLEYEDSPILQDTVRFMAQPKFGNARALLHKELQTSQTFMLNHFPFLSQRPGLLSYSRGYHDSLSVFPIEYFEFSPLDLELYNIRHLVSRAPNPPAIERLGLHVKPVHSNAAFVVFESTSPTGYFQPVRTAGFVYGDYKLARTAVAQHIVPLFERKLVFEHSTALPPKNLFMARSDAESKEAIQSGPEAKRAKLQQWLQLNSFHYGSEAEKAARFPILSDELPHSPLDALVWNYMHVTAPKASGEHPPLRSVLQGVAYPRKAEVFLRALAGFYTNATGGPGMKVIREWVSHTPAEYSAEVFVPVAATKPLMSVYPPDHERLLLKVTYHPYWECYYHTLSSPNVMISRDEALSRTWYQARLHHVTPNMLAIDLPVGHHEVLCRFRNPDAQKFGALFCLCGVAALCVWASARVLVRGLRGLAMR